MAAITALLYVVELADALDRHRLNDDGIVPRRVDGLGGVLWAPLLHDNWMHLVANTVPLLVFGFLALAGGIAQFAMVTAIVWLASGLGTWLTADTGTTTIGASGVIFGWFAFLLARGLFARSVAQVVLALVLLVMWGGLLFGVLPGALGISWQAHLFGALGGVLAARIMAGADRRARRGGAAPDALAS